MKAGTDFSTVHYEKRTEYSYTVNLDVWLLIGLRVRTSGEVDLVDLMI